MLGCTGDSAEHMVGVSYHPSSLLGLLFSISHISHDPEGEVRESEPPHQPLDGPCSLYSTSTQTCSQIALPMHYACQLSAPCTAQKPLPPSQKAWCLAIHGCTTPTFLQLPPDTFKCPFNFTNSIRRLPSTILTYPERWGRGLGLCFIN